jgi:hypothetical protein
MNYLARCHSRPPFITGSLLDLCYGAIVRR